MGKIKENWEEFRHAALAEDISEDEIAIAELGFYSGAITTLSSIAELNTEDPEVAIKKINAITQELREFWEGQGVVAKKPPSN